MDLKDFIKTTLIDIAEAIHDAKLETSEKIAIAPFTINGKKVSEISYIDFDLAVTANEFSEKTNGSDGKMGGGINVLGNKISAGVDGSKQDIARLGTEKVSRISFKVPVAFSAKMKI